MGVQLRAVCVLRRRRLLNTDGGAAALGLAVYSICEGFRQFFFLMGNVTALEGIMRHGMRKEGEGEWAA